MNWLLTFLILMIVATSLLMAEMTKSVFNPFTGQPDFITALSSSTLPTGSSNYIQNTETLQTGATFFVSSGTVNGNFTVNSTNSNMKFLPGVGLGGPSYIWMQGASPFAATKFDLTYSALNNGTTISHLLFSNANSGSQVQGWNFEDGTGAINASISTAGKITTISSITATGSITTAGTSQFDHAVFTMSSSSPTVPVTAEAVLAQVDTAAPCFWTYDSSGNRYHLCFTPDNPAPIIQRPCTTGMPLGLLLGITCP